MTQRSWYKGPGRDKMIRLIYTRIILANLPPTGYISVTTPLSHDQKSRYPD